MFNVSHKSVFFFMSCLYALLPTATWLLIAPFSRERDYLEDAVPRVKGKTIWGTSQIKTAWQQTQVNSCSRAHLPWKRSLSMRTRTPRRTKSKTTMETCLVNCKHKTVPRNTEHLAENLPPRKCATFLSQKIVVHFSCHRKRLKVFRLLAAFISGRFSSRKFCDKWLRNKWMMETLSSDVKKRTWVKSNCLLVSLN